MGGTNVKITATRLAGEHATGGGVVSVRAGVDDKVVCGIFHTLACITASIKTGIVQVDKVEVG